MLWRILIAGLIGFLVFFTWAILSNGIFGFYGDLAMKQVDGEAELHDYLKQHVTEPGGYVVNPVPGEEGYPPDEPVYGLRYAGMGHGAAGRMVVVHIIRAFLISALAAWLLLYESGRRKSGYLKRLIFFVLLGVLVAVSGDLPDAGIGAYPLRTALLLGGQTVIGWLLVGLILAAWLRPGKAKG